MTGPDAQPADPGEPGGAGRSPLSRAQARDELLARLAAQLRTAQTANERRLAQLEATTAESADLLAQALPRIDTALDQLATLTDDSDKTDAALGSLSRSAVMTASLPRPERRAVRWW